jgi:DNA-binding transcriptional regulator YiaG
MAMLTMSGPAGGTTSYSSHARSVGSRVISVAALTIWGFAGTTSVVQATPARHDEVTYVSSQTGNGVAVTQSLMSPERRDSGSRIRELHDRSGLSWQQIARLFGVSRRAVHLWASGNRMTHHHANLLQKHLAVVSDHDQGEPGATREHLLDSSRGEHAPYQLMVNFAQQSQGKPLRGELPAVSLLTGTEETPVSATEVVRGSRRLGRASNRGVDGEPGGV